MKGKTTLVGILVFFALFLGFLPANVSAASCSDFDFAVINPPPNVINCSNDPTALNITVTSRNNLFIAGQVYTLNIANAPQQVVGLEEIASSTANSQSSISFSVPNLQAFPGTVYYHKIKGPSVGAGGLGCTLPYSYKIAADQLVGEVYISQSRGGQTCYGFPAGCLESGTNAIITVENVKKCGVPYANENLRVKVTGPNPLSNFTEVARTNASGNLPPLTKSFSQVGVFEILVEKTQGVNTNILKRSFTVGPATSCTSCLTDKPVITVGATNYAYRICDQVSSTLDTPEGGKAYDRCLQCIGGDVLGRAGIWTAVGCIPREPDIIVKSLLRLGLGMGGGFALIIILASGFVLSISQGEAKRIEDAKQWLTSALVGMLFIIFSVTILHFIGYTIFKIPGFGG